MNGEDAMLKMFGSMSEVTEVMANPDLNAALPPSEWVDDLRWTNNFSPICAGDSV